MTPRQSLTREWLVTNGLGGYAAGTVGGVATRRYHGLLTAALPAPLGRQMRLNRLGESLCLPGGRPVPLGNPAATAGRADARRHVTEFWLELGLPVWRYEVSGHVLEKRVVMPYMQNTVYVRYRLLAGASLRLALRPAVHFRRNDAPVSDLDGASYTLTVSGPRYELSDGSGAPPLRIRLHALHAELVMASETFEDVFYIVEERRGYEASGSLWSPGCFEMELTQGDEVALVTCARRTIPTWT